MARSRGPRAAGQATGLFSIPSSLRWGDDSARLLGKRKSIEFISGLAHGKGCTHTHTHMDVCTLTCVLMYAVRAGAHLTGEWLLCPGTNSLASEGEMGKGTHYYQELRGVGCSWGPANCLFLLLASGVHAHFGGCDDTLGMSSDAVWY